MIGGSDPAARRRTPFARKRWNHPALVIGLAAYSIWRFARVIRRLFGCTERLGLMYASINH
jgi:hypothetical protein